MLAATTKLNDMPQQNHYTPRSILRHFGLREDPFGATPDPRFLYLTDKYREALATLEHGIQYNRGFLVLIAPPGLGKTTLLYHLLEKFRSTRSATTAFIFQTQCDSRELIRHLMTDLGLSSDVDDLVRIHQQLNEFLAKEANSGRQVILFIDEAQNLKVETLETVRLLSNFETSSSKLLQIILSGQPSLATKLGSRSMLQLRQRVFTTIYLAPLTESEANGYIDHRLSVAGCRTNSLFTPEARAALIARSQGVPRVLNALCFRALLLAYKLNVSVIGESVVMQTVASLGFHRPSSLVEATTATEPELRTLAVRPPQSKISTARAETESVTTRETEIVADPASNTPATNHTDQAPFGTQPEEVLHNVDGGKADPPLDTDVEVRENIPVGRLPGVLKAIRDAESELDGRGRVDVRYSIRGKLAHVTVEADSAELTRKHVAAIARALQTEIGR